MPSASEKYKEALNLYKNTSLTIVEISRLCNVTRSGLASYIYKHHRDLLLTRNGLTGDPCQPIRYNKGQSPKTHKKYKHAIEACDSEEYIHLNISQIAQLFHLDGTALANQLRTHYPDIIPRRESERQKRGIADNVHRGVRKSAKETYSEAVKILRDTDKTIEEAADECGVSFSGLRQHLLYYHKDLVSQRELKRKAGQENPKTGAVSGNGQRRVMPREIEEKYSEGVSLYRNTSLPITEIAQKIGVNTGSFRHHLRLWHSSLMLNRRGAEQSITENDRPSFEGTKRYNKASAEKYAEAINLLKTTDISTEAAAKKFGFIPEVLRSYIKEHEPELFKSLGMITLPNGRRVLKRSYDKYAQAIEEYSASSESLKSIALRLNIPYNSLGGFIKRNMPELIKKHN